MQFSVSSLRHIPDIQASKKSPLLRQNSNNFGRINTKYLSIFLSNEPNQNHQNLNTFGSDKKRGETTMQNVKKTYKKEVNSATLPKPKMKTSGESPGKNTDRLTLKKCSISSEKDSKKSIIRALLGPYLQKPNKESKTPKFEAHEPKNSISSYYSSAENNDKTPELLKEDEDPPHINLNSNDSLKETKDSEKPITLENRDSLDKAFEYTLDEYKFLKETIENEKKTLAEEIHQVTLKAYSRIDMKINEKNTNHWTKLRRTLTAVSRMQQFTNQIKNYGTSYVLSGLNVKMKQLDEHLLKRLNNFLWIPGGKFLIIWEFMLLLAINYTFLVTPVKITFFYDKMNEYSNWRDFEIVLSVFFGLDMLVNFNTAYIDENKIILKRSKIASKYMKFWFWIDFISIISANDMYKFSMDSGTNGEPLSYLVAFFVGSDFHELLRILRIRKIMLINKIFEKLQDFFKIKYTFIKLIKFLLTTLFCLHLTSCFWFFGAKVKGFSYDTWVFNYGLDTNDYFSMYLTSFYWATETLSTVGYGDVHAYNELEFFISICWLILGAGFYSYTIGSISNVITSDETKRSQLFHKKIIMETFMQDHKLSKPLKHKIKQALEYHSAKSIFSHTDKNEILNEIPVELKFQIATSLISNMKTHIPFFSKKDKVFMANFIPLLTPLSVAAREFVYRKSEYPYLFYILLTGRINYIEGNNKLVFKTIIEGSYFGEIEIFNNTVRAHTLQAFENLDLLIIQRNEFEKVMLSFPEIEAELKQIASQKLLRIQESLDKIKDLLALHCTSPFWTIRRKPQYQLFKENRLNRLRASSHSPVQRKNSISSFSGYFSTLMRKRSISNNITNSPKSSNKIGAALNRLSVFSGKKDATPINMISSMASGFGDNLTPKSSNFSPELGNRNINNLKFSPIISARKVIRETDKQPDFKLHLHEMSEKKKFSLKNIRKGLLSLEEDIKNPRIIDKTKENIVKNNANELTFDLKDNIDEKIAEKTNKIDILPIKNTVENRNKFEILPLNKAFLGNFHKNLLSMENIAKNTKNAVKIEKSPKNLKNEQITENLKNLVNSNKMMLKTFETEINELSKKTNEINTILLNKKQKNGKNQLKFSPLTIKSIKKP